MKKFKYILCFIFVLMLFSKVFAEVVTTRRINQSSTNDTVNVDTKLSKSIRTCTPYSETATFDFQGMNFNYNIRIAGWVNNLCRMDFVSDVSGASSSFNSIYGVSASDAEIFAFAPKFRCEFTKTQLDDVGDAILEEESRKRGGKMLKNPDDIEITSFSGRDFKLMKMLVDGRTCRMLNAGDVDKILNSIFGY